MNTEVSFFYYCNTQQAHFNWQLVIFKNLDVKMYIFGVKVDFFLGLAILLTPFLVLLGRTLQEILWFKANFCDFFWPEEPNC